MDEGRIAHVRKIEKYNKKYVESLNLILHIQKERDTKCIRIDKQCISDKIQKSIMAVKNDVVRKRVLQQCLKMRSDNECVSPYGSYGGKSVQSFTPEIEQYIIEMHPKQRRIRKANMLKDYGKERGAIFTHSGYKRKVEEFFSERTNQNADNRDILAGNRKIQGLITHCYGNKQAGRASLKLPPVKASDAIKMTSKH